MTYFYLLIKLLPFLLALAALTLGIKRRMKPKIFVQIASYRDPECQNTIENLFAKAKYQERVNVGICWQFDKEADSKCFEIPYSLPKQVRVIEVDARDGKGVCWARNLTQSLYKGEKYTLVIDSHMRFVDGWDELMINELKSCGSKKAVLSCYPASYKPPDKLEQNPKLTVQVPTPFNEMGDIRFKGEIINKTPEQPLKGRFLAAGFMFSSSKVIKEVPYDPHMYFNQEEISYALRLFTHGWDIYHPTKVMLYHYYKSPNDKTITTPLHWEDNKDWSKMQRAGRERLHFMVKHKEMVNAESLKNLDKYGLGSKRSLKEFEEITGVNFKTLNVSNQGLKGAFIERLDEYKNAEESLSAIKVEKSEKPRGTKHDKTLESGYVFSTNLPFNINENIDITLIMVLPIGFKQYLKEFLPILKENEVSFNYNSLQKICITSDDFSEIETFFKDNEISAVFFNDVKLEFLDKINWASKANLEPLSMLIDKNGKLISSTTQRNASNHVGELMKLVKEAIQE